MIENYLPLLVLCNFLFMVGCEKKIPNSVDTAPVQYRTTCEQACDRLAQLKCPGYYGSPEGKACVEVCDYYEQIPEADFCPDSLAKLRGNKDGSCNEQELQKAFGSCEQQ